MVAATLLIQSKFTHFHFFPFGNVGDRNNGVDKVAVRYNKGFIGDRRFAANFLILAHVQFFWCWSGSFKLYGPRNAPAVLYIAAFVSCHTAYRQRDQYSRQDY